MAREKQKKAQEANPLLIVISGPSGVGKDATLATMKEASLPYHYVLTATTRTKRPGEKDRIDYWFISEEKFQDMVKKNQFLEWANVYGNFYGVPKQEIDEASKQGLDTVVKVDVQGASTIKRIMPDALLIFLMPPSFEELANRLKQRYGSYSADSDIRLSKAKEEMKSLPIFDYVITNHTDHLDLTVTQINAAVAAEKHRQNER
jgi:guanylate kinase